MARPGWQSIGGFALGLLIAQAGCGDDPPARARPTVKVFAASDLQKTFEALGPVYRARTGVTPEFSFGSSGLLAKQIIEGAPADVFFAANQAFAAKAASTGRCDPASQTVYAQGELVMWSRTEAAPPPAEVAALATAGVARIAIANPETAPYGIAAKQALDTAGAWAAVEDSVVIGENVGQTLQYARTGNVEIGFVSRATLDPSLGGHVVSVPQTLYAPIIQAFVVCGQGEPAARGQAFADFVRSADGRALLAARGFSFPGVAPVAAPAP